MPATISSVAVSFSRPSFITKLEKEHEKIWLKEFVMESIYTYKSFKFLRGNFLKPEVEDIKPLSSISKTAQHCKSLIVGHAPDTQVSSYLIIIKFYFSISSPDGLTILVIEKSASENEQVRVNNSEDQLQKCHYMIEENNFAQIYALSEKFWHRFDTE